MRTLEDELRAVMVEASEQLQLSAGTAERAWQRGHRPAAERSPMSLGRTGNRARAGTMSHYSRGRLVALTGMFAVVVVVVTAFALGGKSTESGGAASGSQASGLGSGSTAGGGPSVAHGALPYGKADTPGTPGMRAAPAVPAVPPTLGRLDGPLTAPATSTIGATATRVVKNGSMDLEVRKGQVQATVDKLVGLTTGLGGYVAQSHTSNIAGSPSGEVTLRMPANKFEDAVSAAQKVGHETSLTTSAHDVSGNFVDLNARLAALQRTRRTYLTILGRATTIGQTLEVQQRVEDVQQQIEQVQGTLKVLRNQSADGTLTVAVSETGSPAAAGPHQRHGIGKAWHTSVQRFTRGIDAIVAALGPLLLAVLILSVLIGIVALGYRGVRRATG